MGSSSKDAQFYFLDRSNSQQGGASAESVRNPIPQVDAARSEATS